MHAALADLNPLSTNAISPLINLISKYLIYIFHKYHRVRIFLNLSGSAYLLEIISLIILKGLRLNFIYNFIR